MYRILPSITTTSGANWRQMVLEIDELGLEEIALFPTCLEYEQRQELYLALEKTNLKRIPHVHLRNDFEVAEIEYLTNRFDTEIFNGHIGLLKDINEKLVAYKNLIFIENSNLVLNKELFNKVEFDKIGVAGLCLDLAHLERDRQFSQKIYAQTILMAREYKIGCNHISAFKFSFFSRWSKEKGDSHYLNNLTELDYLANMPEEFLAPIISIELTNSLTEQLEIKKYIEVLLRRPKAYLEKNKQN